MLIYLLPIGLMPVYGLLFRKRKKIMVFFCLLSLFLLLSLRDITLGVDLGNYSEGYKFIKELSFTDLISRLRIIQIAKLTYPFSYESGYTVINWAVSRVCSDFHGFLVVYAGFCMLSVGVFIYRYSKIPWLSCLLYACLGFFNLQFGILRQSLALCILLWSVPFIKEKKPIKFLILVFLAFTVHRVSIIFLPFYLFANKKFTKRTMWKYIFSCCGFVIISSLLFRMVVTPILIYIGKGGYIKSSFALNNMLIMMIIIDIIIFLFINMNVFKDWNNKIALYAVLISLPIEIMGTYHDLIARSVVLYWIFICILLPNLIYDYRDRDIKIAAKALITGMALVFEAYLLHGSELVPYIFYK